MLIQLFLKVETLLFLKIAAHGQGHQAHEATMRLELAVDSIQKLMMTRRKLFMAKRWKGPHSVSVEGEHKEHFGRSKLWPGAAVLCCELKVSCKVTSGPGSEGLKYVPYDVATWQEWFNEEGRNRRKEKTWLARWRESSVGGCRRKTIKRAKSVPFDTRNKEKESVAVSASEKWKWLLVRRCRERINWRRMKQFAQLTVCLGGVESAVKVMTVECE